MKHKHKKKIKKLEKRIVRLNAGIYVLRGEIRLFRDRIRKSEHRCSILEGDTEILQNRVIQLEQLHASQRLETDHNERNKNVEEYGQPVPLEIGAKEQPQVKASDIIMNSHVKRKRNKKSNDS